MSTFSNNQGGDWFTATNWSGGVTPGVNDDAFISFIGAPVVISGAAAFARNITVQSSTLIVGGATGSSLTAHSIDLSFSTLMIGGPSFAFQAAGQVTLTDAVHMEDAGSQVQFNASDDVTFAAPIVGLGSVVKLGANVVTLNGISNYLGECAIKGGAIMTGVGSALGRDVVITAGASLRLQNHCAFNGPVTLGGGGLGGKGAVENLAGDSSLGGLITLTADTRINSDFHATGGDTFTFVDGEQDLAGHTLTLGGGGVVVFDATDIIDASNGSLAIDGGASVQILNGDDKLTGAITITKGSLLLGADGAINAASLVNIGASGLLTLGASSAVIGSPSGAGAINLGGGTLSVGADGRSTTFSGAISDAAGAGGLTKIGAGVLTLSGASSYGGVTEIKAGAIDAANDDALGSNAGGTIVDAGAALLMSGVSIFNEALTLAGTGVAGGGALRAQAGVNTYEGAISLAANASITANSSAGLELLGVSSAGASLTIGGEGGILLDFVNLGAGGLTKVGADKVTLTGFGGSTGLTLVANGTLETASSASIADDDAVNVAALGTFEVDVSETIGSLAGVGKVLLHNAVLTVGGDGKSTTFAGSIGETTTSGALTKIGAGLLKLTGADSYSGLTEVKSGALDIANAAALGATTNGTLVDAGASLEIKGGIAIGAEGLKLNGAGVANTGALRNLSGVNSYGASITLLSDATIGASNGQLTIKGVAGAGKTLTLTGAGAIVVSGVIGAGALKKSGSGKATLNGADTISGGVTVSGGTLSAGAASAFGSGAIDLAATGATLEFAATATYANALIVENGKSVRFAAAAGRVATLTGAFTQTAASLHLGSTTDTGEIVWTPSTVTNAGVSVVQLDGGALVLGDAGAAAVLAAASRLSLAAGAQLDLNGHLGAVGSLTGASGALIQNTGAFGLLTVLESQSTIYDGALSGAMGLVVTSSTASKLTLGGANSYTGPTIVGDDEILALTGASSVASSTFVDLLHNGVFDISGVASGTSVKDIQLLDTSGVLALKGKSLTVTAAKVTEYNAIVQGSATAASHLTIYAANVNYSLAGAVFQNWTLAANTIVLRGNNQNNRLTASTQTDKLFGGGGGDLLIAGAGVHYLDGGLGADTLNGVGGSSFADYEDADAGQTINLFNSNLNAGDSAAGDTYVGIHNVLGSAHNDKITGDASGDRLFGGAGDDTIVGGAGADTLLGGAGADTLTGGGGADQFRYNVASEGGDVITDFSAAQGDRISIFHTGFGGGLPASGPLDPQRFVAGTTPTQNFGQFLWDAASSSLSWDVDGAGPQAAVKIAVLSGVTTLSASSIVLF